MDAARKGKVRRSLLSSRCQPFSCTHHFLILRLTCLDPDTGNRQLLIFPVTRRKCQRVALLQSRRPRASSAMTFTQQGASKTDKCVLLRMRMSKCACAQDLPTNTFLITGPVHLPSLVLEGQPMQRTKSLHPDIFRESSSRKSSSPVAFPTSP